MQGSNFTQDLKDRGLATPDSIKTNWDINPSFGGPIMQNSLWFFFSSRTNRADNYVADMFENLNANDPSKWTYEPDLTRPAANEHIWTDNQLRLTWQASQKNKIAVHYMHNTQCRCKATITAQPGRPKRTSTIATPYDQSIAEWTSPMTNRLLLQVSGLYRGQRYNRGAGGTGCEPADDPYELGTVDRAALPSDASYKPGRTTLLRVDALVRHRRPLSSRPASTTGRA